jgi:hypothetical protein
MKRGVLNQRRLFTVLSFLVVGVLVTGCPPPVDPEADVYVRGTVLNVDGSPLANQTVELFKSTAPFWIYTNALENIIEDEGNTFRTFQTEADGSFELHMKGADVNTPDQQWAAHFVAAVFRDTDREMAVVTENHFFSNNDLIWNLGDVQFWDLGSVLVDSGTLYMDFTWPDLPENSVHDYLFYINDGDWAEWVPDSQTSLTGLPVEVLHPDDDNPAWQIIGWSNDLRYRTSKQYFSNQNIFSPITGAEAADGDGNRLDGATDGEYRDKEYFDSSMNTKEVILDLGTPHEVTALVVHHSWIFNYWRGSLNITTSMDLSSWQSWDTADGAHENYGLLYHYVIDPMGRDCRYIKLNAEGGTDVEWHWIGELVAFGTPL